MNHDEKNAPTVVEDLAITNDQANEVKGGAEIPFYLKLHGVDGDVTSIRPSVSDVVVSKPTDAS